MEAVYDKDGINDKRWNRSKWVEDMDQTARFGETE